MSPLRISFMVVTCLVLSQGTLAATAKAPVAGTYATRDQLRECLALDEGLKARIHALEAATIAHNREFESNEVEGAKLVETKAKLDHSDKAAIQAFNQAVLAHNAHLQAMDEEALAADVATKALNSEQAAMDLKCGSLTYRPADMDAVTKERKKAAAAAASAP